MSVTSPARRDVWDAVLGSSTNALVSQTPAWTDFVCAAGGFEDASLLYELPGGRRFILPMVRRRRLLARLSSEASLPGGWGVGGVLAPGGVQVTDAAAVFAHLAGRGVLRTSLRINPLDAATWVAAQPAGIVEVRRRSHILELEGDFSRVYDKRFTSQARQNVRRAEKSGLTVERDTSGRLVPVFYELFERSLDRWAAKQHEPRVLTRWRHHRFDPQRKFERMAEALEDVCRIWVAWRDGEPAAAVIVLQGANSHYTRGAMDIDIAGPTRANYLLHKHVIEDACASGCRYYDMGDSGASASLARYKAAFGARPYDSSDYTIERLPLTTVDRHVRRAVKRLIRFRD